MTEGNYSGEIIIPETVTYNGIAYSVTSIGYGAFAYCSSLTSVTIGNSVTSIGNRAFEKCSSLTSITIPNSVTSIGEYAFRRSSLFSITIPNNVTSIGTLAFDCSSLTSVVWNATNYTSSAQYRFNNAIDSSQITSFTFGDSVKHIPAYLCDRMENLQSVVIPNSVTSIGEGTFYGCSSLTSITIPNSVTSVGGWAFESCYSLTSITIPNSITSIKERTFYGCSSITSITIPENVTSIGSNAFNACSSITSITIPENVTSIGIDAFSNCSSLTSVIWNVINYQSSALSTFSDDVSSQITSFVFGDSVKFIPSYLCANMSALTSIIIPNGVDSIGKAVFGNCKELSSIVVDENNSKYDSRDNCNAIIETETNIIIAGCKTTVIPTSIATIGDYAFYNSLWLTSLVIPNTITTIGNYAFEDCTNLTSITIPNSVTTIGNYSFQDCVGITSVTIPSSVTKIKYGPFAGCVALSSIIVDKNNTTFDSRENCNAIIETETNTLIAGCKNTIIPNGVTCLQYGAFYDCKDLNSIQLPNTITTIENDVFRGCSQLTSIAIPSSVSSIERQPFWECYALSSISVDSDNPTYDSRDNCNAIIETSTNTLIAGCPTTIIPTSVTSIGSGAFQTQHHLTSITIPNGVTNIGYSAFDNCHNLTSVTMGNTITNIEDYAFWMCYSLDTMKCYTAVPPKCTNSSFLMGTPSTVYVPCSSLEAYKSHEIWGEFNIQCLEDLTPSEPQDTTIYLPIVYETICEGTTFVWMGMEFTAAGMFISEEIVEDENYIYHYIHTLELQVIVPPLPDTIVVEAYDSYEWHGKVYTESGTYIYEEHCYQEILQLTIIDTPTPPEPQDTTIYISHPTEYGAICEGGEYYWRGVMITVAGTYTCNEIVEEENYTYLHTYTLELLPLLPDEMIELPITEVTICENELPYVWHICGGVWEITEAGNYMHHEFLDCGVAIYTLELTVIPSEKVVLVEEAYDSYEWHGKVYTESGVYTYRDPYNTCVIEELHLTIIDTPTPPEPEIPTEGIGVFSIGEGKTVTFSRGNLQYTQSTNTWSFASAQWEMIGTDNVTGGSVSSDPTYGDKKYGDALADKVDLFGWSTGATNFGVSTSTDWENDYLGSFVDWGRNKIGNDAPNTWRTLTHDEWYYLRYNRTNADNLVGVAQVNGVKGLVFLPDTWICPEGVTFKSGFSSDYSVEAYGQYQTFTAKQWSVLESVGAVFLPAAGLRNGSFMERVQGNGYYWSASGYNSYYADYLYFYSDRAGMSGYYRDNGQSVRLVKDVNSTTPEPPVEPETEEIFIYQPVDSVTICEWELPYIWRGMYCTEAGTYTHEEIVEDENYIYHYIHTLALQVLPSSIETIVVEAYDSYEWHGKVYTESGVYTYHDPYNRCVIEELHLTIIPSEEKEYVHYYYNDIFVCDGDTYEDPITGIYHLIVEHTTWSDTITGTEVDTIYTFNITPIVAPEPLTEDILYAIGAVPELVAGEMVNTMGTTEPIMWYYQMNDKDDIADVIGVEWVAGHDVVLNTEQTTHTMVLEVWDECYNTRSMKFTFPVSKKDSAPQDTTIYHPTVYETICEGTTFTWMGMDCTEAGLYEYHEIVEGEDYTYHHIYTLELTILPYKRVEYEMIAYDSYEWHGWVYTESGTHTYQSDECTTEVLYLTIIPSGHNQGEVVVEPSTNSVTITWQKEESADSYIIVIKQGDKVICTLIFDAEGNLVSVNYLPGRESNKHGIQHAGLTSDSFQYTITGLTPSTDYTYTVTATDDSDNTISSYSGEFTTHHATSVENTNSQSPTIDCQKILYEDHIYILRDGKMYTIMGQEM